MESIIISPMTLESNMQICRLCGQMSEETIDIFGGAVDNLYECITKYLPITIKTDDTLPLTSCILCANILLSFDQLLTTCVEAQKCFEELELNPSEQLETIEDSLDSHISTQPVKSSKDQDEMHEESSIAVDSKDGCKTFCIEQLVVASSSLKSEWNESECKEVIEGKNYYRCGECGKRLHSVHTFKHHMRIHTGERPFVCDACGKQFRIAQGLQRHIIATHAATARRFACDTCERRFVTRRGLLEHRRVHTDERPFVCDVCGKAFRHKASLFVHRRTHVGDGGDGGSVFGCVECGRRFAVAGQLARHARTHTGERPHVCAACGKAFRVRNDLTRHQLVHSEAKPFGCAVCGLAFRMKRYLKKHMQLNHCAS